jgi:signal transduction histidine kinase
MAVMNGMAERWTGRQGLLWAESAMLLVLIAVDTVFEARMGAPTGLMASVAAQVGPGLGPVTALLALLRRRFPSRVDLLTVSAIGLSFLGTVVSALAAGLGQPIRPQLSGTEALALALLVGASCRRLAPSRAVALGGLGGLAMVTAPEFRFGIDSVGGLLALPAALLWGASLAAGLVLRDADHRSQEALRGARADERLRLARELHDLIAHHITGVVVLAQAARSVASTQPPEIVLTEIEKAGADAMSAMRRLVGVLRTESSDLGPVPADLAEAVRTALPDDDRLQVELAEDAASLSVRPETASTVHRIVLEAISNARRHAPRARHLLVVLRRENDDLVIEVENDGVGPVTRTGRSTAALQQDSPSRNGPQQWPESDARREIAAGSSRMITPATLGPEPGLSPEPERDAAGGANPPANLREEPDGGQANELDKRQSNESGRRWTAEPRGEAGAGLGAQSAGRSGGYGLVGMTERVTALGGSVWTGVRDGRWRVVARLPVGEVER